MKILISSYSFHPSIGGLETVGAILAEEFLRLGHEVRVVTFTPAAGAASGAFEVIRRPGIGRLYGAVRWCDVFLHNNISLRAAWPLLAIRKPWVIAHHIWIPEGGRGRLKRLAIRFGTCISVSQAIASHLSTSSKIISNPYDDTTFHRMKEIRRDRDLIFVGRLISDKGAHLALHAVGRLRDRGTTVRLTVVGAGPEEVSLRGVAKELAITNEVTFAGVKTGSELAVLLNAHRVLVVPSIWREPFGVVALEGIACGCSVVGSDRGGLPEAIGPCGFVFPSGDVEALTQRLEQILTNADRGATSEEAVRAHLSRHTRSAVAEAYLQVLRKAASSEADVGHGRSEDACHILQQ